jgi:hypothetical protein
MDQAEPGHKETLGALGKCRQHPYLGSDLHLFGSGTRKTFLKKRVVDL